jgi:tetratricopeptide (TPR) repeat protein
MISCERRHMASCQCLGLAAMLVVSAARADPPLGAPQGTGAQGSARTAGSADAETPPEAAAQARDHFKKARDLYQTGSYHEALAELDAAHALDPHAKDLVFNLGVVNEKLGQIDDALKYFHIYSAMNLDAQERARADAYIKRLEGAKREIALRTGPEEHEPPPLVPPKPVEHPPPKKGRVDAATVTAASFAVAGVAVGAIFGIKALSDQPSNFVVGRDGTADDYANQQSAAHREAIISDIGFGVGLAATVVTAYLYLARPKVQVSSQTGRATVSAAPTTGGGVFVLKGSF